MVLRYLDLYDAFAATLGISRVGDVADGLIVVFLCFFGLEWQWMDADASRRVIAWTCAKEELVCNQHSCSCSALSQLFLCSSRSPSNSVFSSIWTVTAHKFLCAHSCGVSLCSSPTPTPPSIDAPTGAYSIPRLQYKQTDVNSTYMMRSKAPTMRAHSCRDNPLCYQHQAIRAPS